MSRDELILDPCNVFVKFLPPLCSDEQLQHLFSKYGNIVSSKVMKDEGTGKSLGYGFVRFEKSEEAMKAIEGLNQFKIENKRLLCKLAYQIPVSKTNEMDKIPVETRNVFIKHLPRSYGNEELRRAFDIFGEIKECKVLLDPKTQETKGVGFVRYEDEESAQKAISEMRGKVLERGYPPLVVKLAHASGYAKKKNLQTQKYVQDPYQSWTNSTDFRVMYMNSPQWMWYQTSRNNILPYDATIIPPIYQYYPIPISPSNQNELNEKLEGLTIQKSLNNEE